MSIFLRFAVTLSLFIFSLQTLAGSTDPRYPAAWWQEFPREGSPSWEILPQDAGPGEVILSKRTELGVFSNFAATPITLDGKTYASIEGFWQMMLYPEDSKDPRSSFPGIMWPHSRAEVGQMVGFAAKAAGDLALENMHRMRINWVSYEGKKMIYWTSEQGTHYRLIKRAMAAKLAQHPDIKKLLLATGDLILKPDHHQERGAPPAWHYFAIWMELREELAKK